MRVEQLGTRAATLGVFELSAFLIVVTSTGERAHVMHRPNDRNPTADLLYQCFQIDEVGNPVQVDDVAIKVGRVDRFPNARPGIAE